MTESDKTKPEHRAPRTIIFDSVSKAGRSPLDSITDPDQMQLQETFLEYLSERTIAQTIPLTALHTAYLKITNQIREDNPNIGDPEEQVSENLTTLYQETPTGSHVVYTELQQTQQDAKYIHEMLLFIPALQGQEKKQETLEKIVKIIQTPEINSKLPRVLRSTQLGDYVREEDIEEAQTAVQSIFAGIGGKFSGEKFVAENAELEKIEGVQYEDLHAALVKYMGQKTQDTPEMQKATFEDFSTLVDKYELIRHTLGKIATARETIENAPSGQEMPQKITIPYSEKGVDSTDRFVALIEIPTSEIFDPMISSEGNFKQGTPAEQDHLDMMLEYLAGFSVQYTRN